MVSQTQKSRALQFICGQLEDSGLYLIQSTTKTGALVKEKPEVREQPRQTEVVIPNFLGNIGSFVALLDQNSANDTYTSPVFYKDRKAAFVRMVERNRSWREDKSLKNYSPYQINQMLHLRGIEKRVMENFGDTLVYYQPETENLAESLREFELKEVILDYSHIGSDDQAYDFVEDRPSVDYKIPLELRTIAPAARFLYLRDDSLMRARLAPIDKLGYLLNLLEEEKTHPSEELAERIAICFDSCSQNGRKVLTSIFGEEALGGYAPRS